MVLNKTKYTEIIRKKKCVHFRLSSVMHISILDFNSSSSSNEKKMEEMLIKNRQSSNLQQCFIISGAIQYGTTIYYSAHRVSGSCGDINSNDGCRLVRLMCVYKGSALHSILIFFFFSFYRLA